ncbi:MAG TPA: 7-carboxy-7-deazaguanine synthase QueE [Candidatus Megaira endosymbiont of Hartmannula sinica]|nr:7-carboxy-7-deazaguanine synthase QueE [Candidatus Megaera endosymbiont of Hartmannula sinica]
MFGQNIKEPPVKSDKGYLDVYKIFSTIQGEGVYSGYPAIFIRLSGCNLACTFCDTAFDKKNQMSLNDIIIEIDAIVCKFPNISLIVITGGEPMRQDIRGLCNILISKNFKVQIETNGTIYREINNNVKIICSPKCSSNNKYYIVDQRMVDQIDIFKFIISASENYKEYSNVPDIYNKYNIPIYIQPMDEYNKEKNIQNYRLCVSLSMNMGYIISLQTHKILNIE